MGSSPPPILDYSNVRPESRLRRFFRRDLPLAIIFLLVAVITVFVLIVAITPRIDR